MQQIDIADLAHRLAGIGVVELDLVDALELGRRFEAIRLRLLRIGAGLVLRAGAVVALDDEGGRFVQHVEVADGNTLVGEGVEPAAARPVLRGDIEFDNADRGVAVDAFHLPSSLYSATFEQAIKLRAVLRHRKALEAARALQVECWHLLGRIARQLQQRIVGRQHRLAVDDGREDIGQPAFGVELQDVGAEFVTDPEAVGNRLDRFDVEIGAGQIALVAAFEDDREGGFLVRVERNRFLRISTLPVSQSNFT